MRTRRLIKELLILARIEQEYGISATPAAKALIADDGRPSGPEPPRPAWKSFTWPESGDVDLRENQ